jgi:hypothetical protein
MQTGVNFFGKLKQLAIAIKLEGLASTVVYGATMVAINQMSFEAVPQRLV